MENGRRQLVVLLLLCGLTLTVFAGVRRHEFVHYDDAANIYDNPHVASLSGSNLKWMFTDSDYARRYMPLGWLCYAVNRQLFGLNPGAFHLVNLALHLVNVGLLFVVLKRLLKLSWPAGGAAGERAAIGCAGVGALFWALNPLRVEVVAWASGQIYGVVFLLTMVWILAWLESRREEISITRRRTMRWLAVVAYAASLFTYPLGLFAPVLLLA